RRIGADALRSGVADQNRGESARTAPPSFDRRGTNAAGTDMVIRKFATLAVGATAAVALAASAAAQEITLKAGSFLPLTVNFGEPFKKFVDQVNAEGKGQVQINVVGGPE